MKSTTELRNSKEGLFPQTLFAKWFLTSTWHIVTPDQAGLVEVIPVADGEPFYRLSARFVAAAVLQATNWG